MVDTSVLSERLTASGIGDDSTMQLNSLVLILKILAFVIPYMSQLRKLQDIRIFIPLSLPMLKLVFYAGGPSPFFILFKS